MHEHKQQPIFICQKLSFSKITAIGKQNKISAHVNTYAICLLVANMLIFQLLTQLRLKDKSLQSNNYFPPYVLGY